MPLDPELLVEAMLDSVDRALNPVLFRVGVVETRLTSLGDLQSAILGLTKDLGAIVERVKALELIPPPPGPPGPAGPQGADGKDGQDGKPGLQYLGVYVEGKTYELGDLVTWAGSSWHCNESTTSKPGEGSSAWTLMVKRGRDGKDLR